MGDLDRDLLFLGGDFKVYVSFLTDEAVFAFFTVLIGGIGGLSSFSIIEL